MIARRSSHILSEEPDKMEVQLFRGDHEVRKLKVMVLIMAMGFDYEVMDFDVKHVRCVN